MDAWLIAVIIVLLLVAVGVIAYATMRTRGTGSRRLKERFGPEYDRVVEGREDRSEGERELRRRLERHEQLEIRDLTAEQRERYTNQWGDVQRRFVDHPQDAIGEADRLITQVMRDRGYPTEHFDQKIEDLSVDHAEAINSYRQAHEVADRHERTGVSTDELRLAMQHYRSVFEDLVGTQAA